MTAKIIDAKEEYWQDLGNGWRGKLVYGTKEFEDAKLRIQAGNWESWEMEDYNTKYIAVPKLGSFKLVKGDDGLWRSEDGAVWALADYSASVDPVDRCGVGIFSLSSDNPLTGECRYHDYAYSSAAYQAFHTRSQADEYLESLIKQEPTAWSILAKPFYWLSRVFGAALWENQTTRDN